MGPVSWTKRRLPDSIGGRRPFPAVANGCRRPLSRAVIAGGSVASARERLRAAGQMYTAWKGGLRLGLEIGHEDRRHERGGMTDRKGRGLPRPFHCHWGVTPSHTRTRVIVSPTSSRSTTSIPLTTSPNTV